jgi:hypothetical protein
MDDLAHLWAAGGSAGGHTLCGRPAQGGMVLVSTVRQGEDMGLEVCSSCRRAAETHAGGGAGNGSSARK